MRTYFLLFLGAFIGSMLWRTVFVKKRDRREIRAWVKQIAISLLLAFVVATLLFLIMFHNTVRLI